MVVSKAIRITAISLLTNFSLALALPVLPQVTLKSGTNIRVRLSQTLNSKTAQTGSLVMLSVVDAVKVDGVVVIEAGAQAEGTVSNAKKAGLIGTPGAIGITVNTVQAVDGTKVAVMATAVRDGENKMVMSVILGLLCLVGFLMSGGEGTLDSSQMIDCRVLSDTDIDA
jgi:hypothetical protein|tara:strand:+ start:1258 stop:1764 length:507 start_codon:yes stop_codon:yes gene_type:complete